LPPLAFSELTTISKPLQHRPRVGIFATPTKAAHRELIEVTLTKSTAMSTTDHQPVPPPSNAKETPIGVLNTAAHDAMREQSFNAIMADLGEPTYMQFERDSYSGCDAYEASKVEQVLRKHLGLPSHPLTLSPL
jgi:hypothetical protein